MEIVDDCVLEINSTWRKEVRNVYDRSAKSRR